MNGAYNQYLKIKGHCPSVSKAQEDELALRKEEAILRLARIQNGKEPSHCKGGRCAGK
jgi:hypothetical protein